jgi:hypothetical protein
VLMIASFWDGGGFGKSEMYLVQVKLLSRLINLLTSTSSFLFSTQFVMV